MTEAELMELAHSAWSMHFNYKTFSVTLLFAYLVAAHTAGRQLTLIQLLIVNFLYISLSLWNIAAQYLWASQAMEAAYLAAEMTTQRSHRPAPFMTQIIEVVLFATCQVVSLYFMWSVRHPKTE